MDVNKGASPRDHRQTLLIIDDDPTVVSLIDGTLKAHYHIRVALDGESGLRLACGNEVPDLILLDVVMPGMDGYKSIRRHPTIGADILGRYDSDLMHMARSVALTHHEKWDGSGYPHALKAEAIPLEGRIVAVADVFDALTTARPYKKAWPVEEAVGYLRAERGQHFEPRLVDHFVDILPEILEIKEKYAE